MEALAVCSSVSILIVDSDRSFSLDLSSYLSTNGYMTHRVSSMSEMQYLVEQWRFDLIVLDIAIPGEDGIDALRRFRTNGAPPIIIVSAASSDTDKIIALELGADDYVTKPCNQRELIARIRAVLRRVNHFGLAAKAVTAPPGPLEPPNHPIQDTSNRKGWLFDVGRRLLWDRNGLLVGLSESNLTLLETFIENSGQILSTAEIIDIIKKKGIYRRKSPLYMQLSRLRYGLAKHPGGADLIKTLHRKGYTFAGSVYPDPEDGVIRFDIHHN